MSGGFCWGGIPGLKIETWGTQMLSVKSPTLAAKTRARRGWGTQYLVQHHAVGNLGSQLG